MTPASTHPRPWLRSTAALVFGFVAVVALSLGTDQVLHILKVYPPWGQPMYDPGLCLLALAYRIVYTVAGGYIAASCAPRAPMGHALALGVLGSVTGAVGAIATIPMRLSPPWFPIMLALTALPSAWLGGVLHRLKQE
jgi:hypothetical protein